MKQAHINTVSLPIERLIPHPKNPNTHPERQIAKLRHLIKTHGYAKGSVVYQLSTHYILAGHGIVGALKAEGYTHVDAVELDIDDSKAEAFMIADNKVASDAIIDDIALQNLINELSADNVPSLDFGFDTDDLEALASQILADSGGIRAEPQDDDIPETVEPITKTGDLWMLGKHRVYYSDSTIPENVGRLLDGNKVDLIFTDPPYGINLDTDYSGISQNWKGQVPSVKSKKYEQVINDNKSFNFNDFDYLDIKEQFWWGANYYIDKLFKGGSWFIWDKTAGNTQQVVGNEFEMLWSKIKHRQEMIICKWSGVMGLQTQDVKHRIHPTQKPLEVHFPIIDSYSEPDNIILDLFLGSGSTLIACQKLNRVCFGMEIDQHYCDVIVKRYIDFVGSDDGVFVDRDGQKLGYEELTQLKA